MAPMRSGQMVRRADGMYVVCDDGTEWGPTWSYGAVVRYCAENEITLT